MKHERLRTVNGHLEKLCLKCSEWKDRRTQFSVGRSGRKNHRYGIRSWCKSCSSQSASEWRKENNRFADPLTRRIQYLVSRQVHADGSIRSADIRKMWASQNGLCFYTGVPMKIISDVKHDPLVASLDRVDPAKGYVRGNVVLCCLGMNHLKSVHSVDSMYENLRLFHEGAKRIGRP